MRLRRKLFALFAALVLAMAGCGDDATDRLNTAVHTFADALNKGDAQAAAAVTTDPAQASDALGKLFDSLGKNTHFEVSTVDRKDNDATLRLAATWKFGKDGRNQWTYTTTGSASQDGDTWKIQWNPATVAPGLGTGPLSYSTLTPDPAARVLDRTGAELLTQQVVTLVNVSPGADVNAVAALLNPIDAGITAESLQTQLSAANGQPVTAVTLRAEDLAPIEEALSAMPNVTLAPQTRLLTTDKALTSPTLSGLSDLWQRATDDATGWAVSAQTATGSQRVGGQDPKPVADIASTLDIGMSRAAEEALAAVAHPGRDGGHPALDRRRAGRRPEPRRRRAGPDRADGPVSAGLDLQDGDRLGRFAGRPGDSGQRRRLPGQREHRGPPDSQRRQLRPRPGAAAHGVRAVVQHHDGPARGEPAP